MRRLDASLIAQLQMYSILTNYRILALHIETIGYKDLFLILNKCRYCIINAYALGFGSSLNNISAT